MSAIIGGCDSLAVEPFTVRDPNFQEFSERIARNTQIILKEEAGLGTVSDPASGSYFIENLTSSLVMESWKLFLEIEDNGGYLTSFKSGEIQKRITATAILRKQNISFQKEILLGTNKYPDPTERLTVDPLKKEAIPGYSSSMQIIAPPLIEFRAAEEFEKIRQRIERSGKKVFLLPIGNPDWSKARAEFSAGFFGCAGFTIIYNPEFETLQEGLEKAKAVHSEIIVLCSSNEEYKTLAPEAHTLLENNNILVVAGLPSDCLSDLKSKGITHFIHRKSDVLEELKKFADLLVPIK
jgi:methylmalonyl-CoA mutase